MCFNCYSTFLRSILENYFYICSVSVIKSPTDCPNKPSTKDVRTDLFIILLDSRVPQQLSTAYQIKYHNIFHPSQLCTSQVRPTGPSTDVSYSPPLIFARDLPSECPSLSLPFLAWEIHMNFSKCISHVTFSLTLWAHGTLALSQSLYLSPCVVIF